MNGRREGFTLRSSSVQTLQRQKTRRTWRLGLWHGRRALPGSIVRRFILPPLSKQLPWCSYYRAAVQVCLRAEVYQQQLEGCFREEMEDKRGGERVLQGGRPSPSPCHISRQLRNTLNTNRPGPQVLIKAPSSYFRRPASTHLRS